jgi:hypothetical protein
MMVDAALTDLGDFFPEPLQEKVERPRSIPLRFTEVINVIFKGDACPTLLKDVRAEAQGDQLIVALGYPFDELDVFGWRATSKMYVVAEFGSASLLLAVEPCSVRALVPYRLEDAIIFGGPLDLTWHLTTQPLETAP